MQKLFSDEKPVVLPQPKLATEQIYGLILSLTRFNANERPEMTSVVRDLSE